MAATDTVRTFLTYADLDDRDSSGCSISARHEAVLTSGRRVVLLDDRGWSSSQSVDDASVEEVERTARIVVGPDEPARGQTRAQADANHWAALARNLQAAGISADRVDLQALPHEVELSDRLRRRLKR